MDQRFEQLKSWVSDILGRNDFSIAPASADASFRRYFRVQLNGTTHIVMDAPPDKEDSRPYVAIALRLHSLGLNVPEIVSQDLPQGFLLISDLGTRTYLNELNERSVERLYGDALSSLVVLQAGIFQDHAFLPPYSRTILLREMELFREWYLGRHRGLDLTAEQQTGLSEAFNALADAALAQPLVWVHRDYHSRNLMVTTQHNPGILDFQDAVVGPITYDLVSLLRDCYIAWPRARIEDWVRGYHELGRRSGLPVGDDADLFLRWFDWMGVQRHLKAVGIFARLNHRDGKPGYLNDIPRTLGYIVDVAGRYAELQGLHRLLQNLPSAP